MNSRASTRTRLSVLPVFIALMFNVIAPIATVAVPDAAPEALRPQRAEASDDALNGTQFTLAGCRLEAGDFIEATTTCEDAAYTTGNLGKEWAELDLVPYRLTIGSPGDQTFTIAVAADGVAAEGDGPEIDGYDVISGFVVNSALSEGSCAIAPLGGNQYTDDDAAGGIDQTIYQLVTITASEDAECVFDLYMRLALGASKFPGASLHGYLLAHDLDSIGQRSVSIFVREIAPQLLDKTMTATRGSAYGWSIVKSSDPTSINFSNTCLPDASSRQANVSVTVSWTRSGPTGSGDVTVTTVITATNPAERSIVVNVEDKIYEGTTQDVQFGTTFTGSATIAANSSQSWTHTVTGASDATHFNDVATATYTDLKTGVPVPGNTQAVANAAVALSTATAANASVVITDTESISGNGLSFSVGGSTGASGTFTTTGGGAYTLGTITTGPVLWTSGMQTDSGSVTFNKTVYAGQGTITATGALTDTASVLSDNQTIISDDHTVNITSSATVSLTINKTIPSGALRAGESVTFDFAVYSGATATGTPVATPSIGFTAGGETEKSVTLTGLAPGTYMVHEVPKSGWATIEDRSDIITLPDCSGSVSFDNTELQPDLDATKLADAASVSAGEQIGFVITVANGDDIGTGVAKDVEIEDPLPGAAGLDWSIAGDSADGGACSIDGELGAEILTCEFNDLAPGASTSVHVVSDTTADSCGEYRNTVDVWGSNVVEFSRFADVEVMCPDLEVVKEWTDANGDPTTEPVSAGDVAYFEIIVKNIGLGTAYGIDLFDEPESGTWTVLEDGGFECPAVIGPDGASCTAEELAPGTYTLLLSYETSVPDCGTILNEVTVSAGNEPGEKVTLANSGSATAIVACPGLNIIKVQVDENGEPTTEPILAGEIAYFEILVWNEGPGVAKDVMVGDDLPAGVEWEFEITDGDGECFPASGQEEGEEAQASFLCDLGDLDVDESVTILVWGETTRDDCGALTNVATVDGSNNDDEVPAAEATILVSCPTLVIDKVADADVITITIEDDEMTVDPEIVTWTLNYTLTNGPVTNAVITDEVPEGLVYVDGSASHDGAYDPATETLTWTFEELSASGSVTFETEVDPETISRVAPTVNVAVISSDQTPEDEGRDAVTVVVEQEFGGNPTPTPTPRLPDTAIGIGINGEPVSVPVELLAVAFLGSLGVMALANVKAARSRRR